MKLEGISLGGFGARLLYNFISHLLSIVYALRHYITEVSMVSRLWYDKGIFRSLFCGLYV